jgi:hypothetical protein
MASHHAIICSSSGPSRSSAATTCRLGTVPRCAQRRSQKGLRSINGIAGGSDQRVFCEKTQLLEKRVGNQGET